MATKGAAAAGAAGADHSAELEEIKKKLRKAKKQYKKAKNHEPEHEEDGEGNWLVAYADMMTLLFGFFVILSAFSTPNAEKLEQLKKETSQAMGGKYTKPYSALSEGLQKTLARINLDKEVTIVSNEQGVTLTSTGALFFDSGTVELKPRAQELMTAVAEVLATEAKGFRVVVEGHTDNVPIVSRDFPSNWELSSARAGTVVRLLEEKGFPRKDLRPVGLADIEPITPHLDAQGRNIPASQATNRRIVIKILKQLPDRM